MTQPGIELLSPRPSANTQPLGQRHGFVNRMFVGKILNQARAHFFAHKWFQVLLSNTNNFICTQLNFHRLFQILLCNPNNLNCHLFTQLNDQIVLLDQ